MQKKLTTLVMCSVTASLFAVSVSGAASPQTLLQDEQGKRHTVLGGLGKVEGKTAEARALQALEKVKTTYGFTQAQGNFSLNSSWQDELGITHTKLDQSIHGLPVYGAQMIVHETDGRVQSITGDYKQLKPDTGTALVTAEAAIQKAVAHTGFRGELSRPATAKLLYYPQGKTAVLSHLVNVAYLDESGQAGNWQIFVSAADGSIVQANNELHFLTCSPGTPAVGTGVGVLGDTKSINTTYKSGTYYLEDRTKAMFQTTCGTIETYDFRNGVGPLSYATDPDNIWNASTQRSAVDAHYYMGRVYDYYYSTFNRNSIDGRGTGFYGAVRYSVRYNNAFWDGTRMVYGEGDGTTMLPLSGGYDVTGHELTHGVVEAMLNPTYLVNIQTDALMESISDSFAAVMDSKDWTIGEDIYTPGVPGDYIRSLQNPDVGHMNQYNSSYNRYTLSGIPSKAFYNFSVAIGSRSIAGKVWYNAIRNYLTSSPNFSMMRMATIESAKALYGAPSSYVTALTNAWDSVGVY
ncbi:thermolysin [Tumebacillus sp. BK434]|uniref:M4 family metallopeptidase n=1 Tax=Tumebacillus sp. BK434 TaxID=2512169 RepID=UPI00104EFC3D|nr:M4 family metallopeptidase [Tumebacillus sp. BK434]TCP57633.1 thermolysin [Tumebacillus sp. BK434]